MLAYPIFFRVYRFTLCVLVFLATSLLVLEVVVPMWMKVQSCIVGHNLGINTVMLPASSA